MSRFINVSPGSNLSKSVDGSLCATHSHPRPSDTTGTRGVSWSVRHRSGEGTSQETVSWGRVTDPYGRTGGLDLRERLERSRRPTIDDLSTATPVPLGSLSLGFFSGALPGGSYGHTCRPSALVSIKPPVRKV